MREVAEAGKVNVGLAVADGSEMIYLASVRHERSRSHLPAPPRSRLPIEHTAVGRACLAAITDDERAGHYARLAGQHGTRWARLRTEIERARLAYRKRGWCLAEWLPGLPVVATAIRGPDGALRVLNIGFAAPRSERTRLARHHAPILLKLADDVRDAWTPFAGPAR